LKIEQQCAVLDVFDKKNQKKQKQTKEERSGDLKQGKDMWRLLNSFFM
jgi:hypothetical protein